MSPAPQSDFDPIRLLLFRNDATEILIEPGLRLPALSIRKNARVAEELTAAIKARCGLEAYCLFSLPPELRADGCRYQVAESVKSVLEPQAMSWVNAKDLTDSDFQDAADSRAIRTALSIFDRYRRDAGEGFFGRPNWLKEVTEWVRLEAASNGLHLTGKYRQLNASSTFSLVRFETDGPGIWFKAVGEPNHHEYEVTLRLAELASRFLPRILAANQEWNAWLSIEAEGEHLGEGTPVSSWQTVATALAKLQITSYGSGLHLIGAGCRDLRPATLLESVEPFFNSIHRLMECQTTLIPAPLSKLEIETLSTTIRIALEDIREQLPTVLGHLDCSPGNILVSRGQVTFLDWAEGCVGPPQLTLEYLIEHFRRTHGAQSHSENSIRSSYNEAWQLFLPKDKILRHTPAMPLVAAFAYAASRAVCNANPTAKAAAFLRSLTRLMKHEADIVRQEGFLCA